MDNEEKIQVKREEYFTYFSNGIFEDQRITGAGILIYIALCHHADKNDESCFPSLATIGKESRTTKPTVCKRIKLLEKYKYIRVEHGKDPAHPKRNRVNHYIILSRKEGGSKVETLMVVKNDTSKNIPLRYSGNSGFSDDSLEESPSKPLV